MPSLKKIFYLLAFCIALLTACKKNEIKGDINYSINNIFTTSFSYSLNANNYNWDFGDNNFSNLPNPVHRYKYGGLYHVKLQADNHLIEKDVRIATPDSLKITSFTIKEMPFNPTYADDNQLYNVYWKILNERTGESYTSPVITAVNASNLPLVWDDASQNICIQNLGDRCALMAGFYKQSNNTYQLASGYNFTYNYLFSFYGYPDTLEIPQEGVNSGVRFEFSTQWITNQ